MDPELTQLVQQAHAAIANGKDPQAVAARFRELSGGQDLPSPAEFLGQNAPPPQESDPSILAKPVAMMTGRERMDLRTQQLAGQTGDNPSYTPDQVKAIGPTAAALAVGTAIPGSTLLGREAGYGLSGAVQGGLSAQPGQRLKGALIGGAAGLFGGTAMEAGSGLIGALQRPGGILALKGAVPELRGKIAAAAAEAAQASQNKETQLKGLLDARSTSVNDAADALAAGAKTAAERQIADQTSTTGPRIASRITEIAGVPNKIDEALAQADQGKQAVRDAIYSQIEADYPVITHQPLLAYLKTPELKSATRSIAPQVMNGEPITFPQFQEIRNRFTSGKFGDPAIKTRLSQLGNDAVGGRLAEGDQYYAGFSAFQREAAKAQKAGAWPASQLRRTISKLPTETAKMGFREGQVADLVQKLQQKDAGTPYVQKLLDGGPEMDARLQTIFPNQQDFAAVKQIIADEKAQLRGISNTRDINLAKVENQRTGLLSDLAQQHDAAMQGLFGQRSGDTQRFSLLDQKALSLEEKRQALQESAQRVATRIKRVAAAAGGYGLYRMVTGEHP